jgi:S-adenosylmethionine:tRNA ribosyltransferase-isomerase
VVNGLITGWHNPDASHLLLVESVAGAQLTQRAYDAAAAEGYLWHEFGDSCLLIRDG